jgi:hypothetical protein
MVAPFVAQIPRGRVDELSRKRKSR